MRRCQQFYGDLYARETGARDLTKQQFMVLAALEHNDGASQTALVEMTGIDRSTLAEMVRRMLERGLLSPRTHRRRCARQCGRDHAGRPQGVEQRARRLRPRRTALLDALPAAERARFVKSLATIAAAAEPAGTERRGARAARSAARAAKPLYSDANIDLRSGPAKGLCRVCADVAAACWVSGLANPAARNRPCSLRRLGSGAFRNDPNALGCGVGCARPACAARRLAALICIAANLVRHGWQSLKIRIFCGACDGAAGASRLSCRHR